MTIAVITESYSEDDLHTFFPGRDIAWRILREPGPPGDEEICFDLDFVNTKERVAALETLLPRLIVVNAVTPTLGEIGLPFVRLNGWPGFLDRTVHELVSPDDPTAVRVAAVYGRLGRDYRLVPDVPGMISPRVLSAIINEAFFTWEAGVSSKEEIDIAMRLGTNYPLGPFEWAKQVGIHRIMALLESLSRTSEAYVPSAALRREAVKLKYD